MSDNFLISTVSLVSSGLLLHLLVMIPGMWRAYSVLLVAKGMVGREFGIGAVTFGAITFLPQPHSQVSTTWPIEGIQGLDSLNLIKMDFLSGYGDLTSMLSGPGKKSRGLLFSTLLPQSPLCSTSHIIESTPNQPDSL